MLFIKFQVSPLVVQVRRFLLYCSNFPLSFTPRSTRCPVLSWLYHRSSCVCISFPLFCFHPNPPVLTSRSSGIETVVALTISILVCHGREQFFPPSVEDRARLVSIFVTTPAHSMQLSHNLLPLVASGPENGIAASSESRREALADLLHR